jgi:glutamine synthetase
MQGDVFTADVIDTWLDHKRKHEGDAASMRPHPYELHAVLRRVDKGITKHR